MEMMTNLFSIFDPATSMYLPLNWLASFLFMLVVPVSFWVKPNRYSMIFGVLKNYIYSEFSVIVNKSVYSLLVILSVFVFIVTNNFLGLFPYIFTATSHLSLSLSLALVIWMSLMLYGWVNNYSNIMVHLIPQGTPFILMPFMVIIETISNLIRPGTLAVRLSANMIAGHLLIVLLSSSWLFCPSAGIPLLFMAQLALTSLEIAVAFIQGYVFSVLVSLYIMEFTE